MTSNKKIFGTGRDKWENIRKLLLKDYSEEQLKVITEKWISFLKRDKRLKKNSFIIWNIGNRGSGKTAEVFKITNTTLDRNPKRIVQFWKATDAVIKSINEVCPVEYIGRFENIKKLRDIKSNAILVVDEGLLGANAKEALKKEMRNFIKFLSKSRHYNIIVIINSISYNILLDFRSSVDVLIYRRLPRFFIKQHMHHDVILREYGNKIMKLKDWEGLLVSTYKRFEETGIIDWKYEDHCPWFNDSISMYQETTSPDVVFDEVKRQSEKNKQLVEWAISQVKDKFIGKRGYKNFCMWLYTEYQDKFTDNERELRTIYDLYCYYFDEGIFVGDNLFCELPDVDDNKKYNELIKKLEDKALLFNFDMIEEEALKIYQKKNEHRKTIERNIKIFKERNEKGVDELAKENGLTEGRVYSILSNMRGDYYKVSRDFKIGTVNYYKGHLFEKVYGEFLKKSKLFDDVKIDGAPGKPDIVAFKDDMVIVFSCKNININVSSVNATELAPEIKACRVEYKYVEKRYMVIALYENEMNKLFHVAYEYNKPINLNIKKYLKKMKLDL